MRDKHRAFFDSQAADWDLMFTSEDFERLAHLLDRLGVAPGTNVLDLGCGTGVLFDMLRRRVGPTGSVTGVDFSIEMSRKARCNFPLPEVQVVAADAAGLPFRDDCFDMGVSFSAFPHFSDQQGAIDEVHRVLRSGGRFYIIHLTSSNELSEIHRKVGGAVEHDRIPPEAQMRRMLNGSRFSNVTVEDHPGLYLATAVNL